MARVNSFLLIYAPFSLLFMFYTPSVSIIYISQRNSGQSTRIVRPPMLNFGAIKTPHRRGSETDGWKDRQWKKSLVVGRLLLHISPTDPSHQPHSPTPLHHHRHQLRQNNKSYAYPHGIMGTIYKNGTGSPIQEKKKKKNN